MVPRIPKSEYEDQKTPRICFAKTIQGCLIGINEDHDATGDRYYCYVIDADDYHVPTKEEVSDVGITGEVWMTHAVIPELVGMITVTGINEYREYDLNGRKVSVPIYDYHFRKALKKKELAFS